MDRKPTLALGAAFVVLALAWGSTFPFTKLVNPYLSPMQIVLVRVVCGFVPLLLFALVTGAIRRAHFRYWHHFLVMSFLATTLYYAAYAVAAELLLSGVASVLSGITPMLVFMASALLLPDERLGWRKALGVAIGFMGVIVLADPLGPAVGSPSISLVGIGWVLLGSISLSGSFIYARKFLSELNIPAVALVTYQLGLATLFLIILVPKQGVEMLVQVPGPAVGLVLGLGVVGTGIAYMLYYFIVQRVGAVAASSATYLPPIVGLAISVVLLREPTDWRAYVATAMILSGVWLLRDPKPSKA